MFEWVRANLGRDELFECRDAAAWAQGLPFVVFIDALNEGPLGGKWKARLPEFLAQVRGYPGIKVCVSTRDTYKDVVVDNRFPGYPYRCAGLSSPVDRQRACSPRWGCSSGQVRRSPLVIEGVSSSQKFAVSVDHARRLTCGEG